LPLYLIAIRFPMDSRSLSESAGRSAAAVEPSRLERRYSELVSRTGGFNSEFERLVESRGDISAEHADVAEFFLPPSVGRSTYPQVAWFSPVLAQQARPSAVYLLLGDFSLPPLS